MLKAGQKVRVIYGLDKGMEGEVVKTHTMAVPVAALRVGGIDDKPATMCTVSLNEGHTNMYPVDWIESIKE